jgi:hypothetical protein
MKKQIVVLSLALTGILASGCGKNYQGVYQGTETTNMQMGSATNGANSATLSLNNPTDDRVTGTYQTTNGIYMLQGHMTADAIDSIQLVGGTTGQYYGYYPQQPTQGTQTQDQKQVDCSRYNGTLMIQDKRIFGTLVAPVECGGMFRMIDVSRK